ncbi:MAG: hypothetical protein M3270_04540 [Thermoproteota archaeon]|nr:hypothetical protein [Thermoproteota archaeon]
MRAPIKGDDYFCRQVNGAAEKVQNAFLWAIKPAIEMHKDKVMLGDGTITEAGTFDPQKVHNFFQLLEKSFEGWTFSGILQSTTEDLHRMYSTFSKEADKFHITAYFGIQFHVLLYYRLDREVIEIQKELAKIEDKTASALSNIKYTANEVLATELEKRGCADLEFDDLFARVFQDEKLLNELSEKAAVVEVQFPEFREMRSRKAELISRLNQLLIKFYRISPVLVDYNRLMQGEEGVTNYFDIDVLKKNKKTKRREAFVETTKIPKDSTEMLSKELGKIAETLHKIAC